MASLTDVKSEAMQQYSSWKETEDQSSSSEAMITEVNPSSVTPRESSELPYDMTTWSPDEIAAYTALRSKRKKCCIGGCTHRSLPLARSYHQLPVRNKEVWVKWIEVVRRSRNEPDWCPNGDAAPLVCSRHFPDSDFVSYEASSRVRLSHTAIPIYFVDPPEGTVMDARFSKPLPVPPMLPGPRQKDSSKSKTIKLKQLGYYDEEEVKGQKLNQKLVPLSSLAQYGDNLGYDIEEVTEENFEESVGDEQFDDDDVEIPNHFPYVSMKATNSVVSNSTSINHMRSPSVQQLSTSQSRNRNFKYANSASKPPALIRANFMSFKESLTSYTHSTKLIERANNVNGNNKLKLTLPVPSTMIKQKSPPTKHKIGLAKCRLIVQTLENQLKLAKIRLAEQLEVPYQVVHGVWNMRDSLKDKL